MLETLADRHGILLRREAVDSGVDDRALRRLVLEGELVRVRHGAYVVASVWNKSNRTEQHLLLIHAVLRQYGDELTPSHVSACLLQGGPSWGLPLAQAHVTDLLGHGDRTQAKVRHHRGVLLVDDVSRHDDHWITAPARTALDTASIVPRDPAVCVLDYFLNSGQANIEQYRALHARMRSHPGTLDLHLKLRLADGRSQSVGETRTRLLCRDQGLPAPVPQFEVLHPSGRLAGAVDLAWPDHRLMLEFDGRRKYLADRREGESIEQTVLREKAREDLLRELTGWAMIRLIWADLEHPEHTAARIRGAMARAA